MSIYIFFFVPPHGAREQKEKFLFVDVFLCYFFVILMCAPVPCYALNLLIYLYFWSHCKFQSLVVLCFFLFLNMAKVDLFFDLCYSAIL